ncbi:11555_t:CDS:2 [Entrophospora sp. SA101]|nr:11555_t:CDS:2 [Entrophospora sp. SA101]
MYPFREPVVIYFCSGVIPLDRICSVFATQKSHLKDKDNSIRRKKHQIELAIQKQHDDLVHFSDDRVNHVTNQRKAEDHVTAITFETLKAEERTATLFTSMFDSNDDNKMIPKPIVSAAAIALPETSITGTVTTNG